MRKHGGFSYRKLSCGMQAQSDAAHALGTCLSLLMQSSQIIENNSHVTPVRIIRKDGEFYTIQFADQGRINLRESRLFHTEKEAHEKIRRTPSSNRRVIRNSYVSPYQYNNDRSPYCI